MKKIILSILLVLLLTSCTSDNSEKPLICKSIGFDADKNGGFLVTVLFADTGNTSETGNKRVIKSYAAKNAEEAVEMLLSEMNDAMFKPTESFFIGKSLDDRQKDELIKKIMNTAGLQLKCSVLECENASEYVRSGKMASAQPGFTEYFRIRINT